MVAVRNIRNGEISVLIRLSGIAADVNGCVRYRVAVFIVLNRKFCCAICCLNYFFCVPAGIIIDI